MMYTRVEFADGLTTQLQLGYDVVRIARWAFRKHFEADTFESGLEPEILKVVAMEEGPEFEMTEEELRGLAAELRK